MTLPRFLSCAALAAAAVAVPVHGGRSAVGPAGLPAGITSMALDCSDLAWDALRGRIVATTRSTSTSYPGSLLWIDPEVPSVEEVLPLGQDLTRIVLSGDFRYAYLAMDSANAVVRIDLASRSQDLQFGLGSHEFFGPRYAEDLAVMPGSPGTVAVSRKCKSVSPGHVGVALFDEGVPRPSTTQEHTGSNLIAFGTDPSILYGINTDSTEFGFRRILVDASGLDEEAVYPDSGLQPDFEISGGLAYGVSGRVLDPATGDIVATFPVPLWARAAAAGSGADPVVFCSTGSDSFLAYDRGTRLLTGRLPAPQNAFQGGARKLLRWGADGLAFAIPSGYGVGSAGLLLFRFSDFVDAAAPDGLLVSPGSGVSRVLTWTDNCADETGFEVERKDGDGDFEPAGTTGAGVATFADLHAPLGIPSTYRVRAVRPGGPTGWSEEFAAADLQRNLSVGYIKCAAKDRAAAERDSFRIFGGFGPISSTVNGPFDPAAQGVEAEFGSTEGRFRFSIPPGDPGWRLRRVGKHDLHIWVNPRGSRPRFGVALAPSLNLFECRADHLDFPAPLANPLSFTLRLGSDGTGFDGGAIAETWKEGRPGAFRRTKH